MDSWANTNKIATKLKIGYKTTYRELNVLWNMGLIRRTENESMRDGKIIRSYEWIPNRDELIVNLIYSEVAPDKPDPEPEDDEPKKPEEIKIG